MSYQTENFPGYFETNCYRCRSEEGPESERWKCPECGAANEVDLVGCMDWSHHVRSVADATVTA